MSYRTVIEHQPMSDEIRELAQGIQDSIPDGDDVSLWIYYQHDPITDIEDRTIAYLTFAHHDSGRGCRVTNADAEWGEWNDKDELLTLDDGTVYNTEGEAVEDEEEDE